MEPKESISASIVVKDELSKVVLMPGDPLRAKAVADNYLTNVVCFNDTRNMLGFTGTYKGKKISVMGGRRSASTRRNCTASSASRQSSASAPPAVSIWMSMQRT